MAAVRLRYTAGAVSLPGGFRRCRSRVRSCRRFPRRAGAGAANHVRAPGKGPRHWLNVLGPHFCDLLPAVPHRVAVAESLAVGLPVVLFKPGNPAAVAYMAAADGLRAACLLEVA